MTIFRVLEIVSLNLYSGHWIKKFNNLVLNQLANKRTILNFDLYSNSNLTLKNHRPNETWLKRGIRPTRRNLVQTNTFVTFLCGHFYYDAFSPALCIGKIASLKVTLIKWDNTRLSTSAKTVKDRIQSTIFRWNHLHFM